ncbi:MAG: signal peptidase II [Parasporobacterium sp.]|nr:signal peptidase II [Parasporobacterium sp.]
MNFLLLKKLRIHTVIQIVLFLALTAFDQITKSSAAAVLKSGQDITLLDNILNFHYLENTGASFGILKNRLWIFYVITVIVILLLIFIFLSVYRRTCSYINSGRPVLSSKSVSHMIFINYLIAAISAGALGNLIDRISHQYVIDFIELRFISFPVFNFADICITVSAFILIIFFIFVYREDKDISLFKRNDK